MKKNILGAKPRQTEFFRVLHMRLLEDVGRVCYALLKYDLSEFLDESEVFLLTNFSLRLNRFDNLWTCLHLLYWALRPEYPFRDWLVRDGLEDSLKSVDILLKYAY